MQTESSLGALRKGSSDDSHNLDGANLNMMLGPEESSNLADKRLSRDYPNVFLEDGKVKTGDPSGALASRRSEEDELAGQ